MHPPIILFDFDGVILTQKALEYTALRHLRNDFYQWQNIKNLRPIDLALLFEKSNSENLINLYKNIHINFKPYIPNWTKRDIFITRFGREYRKLEKIYDGLKPGLERILTELKNKKITSGIISNTQKSRLNYFKQKFQLNNYFSVFLTRDDIPFHKPNPYPIIYALKLIKDQNKLKRIDKSKVYFIGDIPSDIKCAKSAGVNSIALLSGHGRKTELENEEPTYIIEKIIDISELAPFKRFLFQ
ncbi:MAG: HAD family hydrolase [Promethearchaeota archaeon]